MCLTKDRGLTKITLTRFQNIEERQGARKSEDATAAHSTILTIHVKYHSTKGTFRTTVTGHALRFCR